MEENLKEVLKQWEQEKAGFRNKYLFLKGHNFLIEASVIKDKEELLSTKIFELEYAMGKFKND